MFEGQFNHAAQGKSRALLVIAPDHAAEIHPLFVQTAPMAGWVRIFNILNGTRLWVDRYGVLLMCRNLPSLFGKLIRRKPEKVLDTLFGDSMHLRVDYDTTNRDVYKPNGTVPITLFWEAMQAARSYSMFIHLCQLCNKRPLAHEWPLGDMAMLGGVRHGKSRIRCMTNARSCCLPTSNQVTMPSL
jgi:hypothetical protein